MKRFYSTAAIVIIFLFPAISADAKHALAGIDNLHVNILHTGEEPNGLAWEKIKTQISNKLNEAGIKVFSPEPGVMYKLPIRPELKICVCLLKLEQFKQADSAEAATSPREGGYVFHIQTLLAKNIYVEVKPALRQKADVWKTEPVMQVVSAQEMSANLNEVALEQVGVFIRAWRAANPKGVQPAFSEVSPKGGPIDAKQVVISEREPAQPPAKTAVTKYLYVASKNSKVFHKSTCMWAQKIAPKNLVRYKTREDAINAGKRPCKRCEP